MCVLGAGPSGIAAAKNLLAAGFRRVVVYDRNAEVGGNWIYSPDPGHSSVFETTHIISSKRLSQYDDFPMPEGYPDYPGHAQLKAYFQSYARHFGVDRVLQLRTEVTSARPRAEGGWTVTLKDGRREEFDALLVASGHHWDPRMPSYPGTFDGELLHSHDYKAAARSPASGCWSSAAGTRRVTSRWRPHACRRAPRSACAAATGSCPSS